MTTIYTVFHRLRAPLIERLVGAEGAHKYDSHEILFQSFSKEKAVDYCLNQVSKVDDTNWKSISKGVIITPIDTTDPITNDTVTMIYY
jgi:hypothetical protein